MLWETGQALLSRNIEQTLTARAEIRRENRAASAPSIPFVVAAQYLAGAFITLFKWWLEAEMPYAPEEMDHIFWHLTLPAAQAAFAAARDEQSADG